MSTRRRLRCTEVVLKDGSVVLARSAGPLQQQDLAAMEEFVRLLSTARESYERPPKGSDV